jgi:TatD DNase family protein
MYIDSHVNLHAPQFAEDLPQVLARAKAADVTLMVNICDRLSNFDACYALAQAHDHIWATIGTHPHEARENPYLSAKDIVDQLRPKVIGIGECGLDYHYDYSPRDIQDHVFRAHIEASRLCGLPLVIHTREADEDMQTILTEEQAKGAFRFLLHCYTSGAVLPRSRPQLTCALLFKPCQKTVLLLKPIALTWHPYPCVADVMSPLLSVIYMTP